MTPTAKDIRARYSVKRKRDFVTTAAISMFILLVVFQFFLTLVMPIVLKKKNAFEFYVEKLEMSSQLDQLRKNIERTSASGKLREGEITLVRGVTDQLAMFTRGQLDYLDAGQIFLLRRILGQYEAVRHRWTEKPPRFYLVQENLNLPAMVQSIESDIEEQPDENSPSASE